MTRDENSKRIKAIWRAIQHKLKYVLQKTTVIFEVGGRKGTLEPGVKNRSSEVFSTNFIP